MENSPVHVHVPYNMLLEKFDMIVRERINPEIYIDGVDLDTFTDNDLFFIRAGLKEAGLKLTIHGPFAGLNPGSPDEKEQRLTIERFRRAFEAARILQPRSIVLHPGFDESDRKCTPELWLTQSMKVWPEFAALAEEEGFVVAIENIFDRDPVMLKALVERIASPNVGVCFDTGHLNIFARSPLKDWFGALGSRVKHVHLHDNNGRFDEHLPMGEGVINFDEFFSLLKANAAGTVVYTIEPHGEDEMRRAIEAIRRYIPAL